MGTGRNPSVGEEAWIAVLPPVIIDWVTVGDPGNACDLQVSPPGYCPGSVAAQYRISKFEVTNAQYAEFLNAVADTDTNALYNTAMGTDLGGVSRSGGSGNYTYNAIARRENMPVNFVSFYDSLRFANWLHNGQPTGAQGIATTEDGAYTMGVGIDAWRPITRNPWASVFLPSESEWYKAAYYDAVSMNYFDYPAASDTQTACALPEATANTANCNVVVFDLTDVGSYTGSASPYGTFDQGGNLWEWDERHRGEFRQLRGGSFAVLPNVLAAPNWHSRTPADERLDVGFRVAAVPEPSIALLQMTALLTLAIYRRGRAWRECGRCDG